jgi:hypothetical protein
MKFRAKPAPLCHGIAIVSDDMNEYFIVWAGSEVEFIGERNYTSLSKKVPTNLLTD